MNVPATEVDEIVPLPALTPDTVVGALPGVFAAAEGFQLSNLGAEEYVVHFSRRPGWVVLTSLALALPTLGFSLLLLVLARRSYRCLLTVYRDGAGAVVQVRGSLPPEKLDALRMLAGGGSDAGDGWLRPAAATQTDVVTETGLRRTLGLPQSVPQGGQQRTFVPSPQEARPQPREAPYAQPTPLPPVQPTVQPAMQPTMQPPMQPTGQPPAPPVVQPTVPVPSAPAQERTAPAPAPRAAAPSRPLLHFDTGETVPFPDLALIGRDPAPSAQEAGAVLLPVVDPERSVSKTHLAVGLGPSGPWVMDRHSTNGVVLEQGGRRARLAPGERIPVGPGTVVLFGDRRITIG